MLAGLGLGLLLAFGGASSAAALTFPFSGFTLPEDDSGFEPDVAVAFTFEALCSVDCVLEVELRYNDVGGLSSPAHVLAGATWDTVGAIAVDPSQSSVVAVLVGPDAAQANADLPDLLFGQDISGHIAFRSDLSSADPNFAGLGAFALSAAGDVTYGGFKLGAMGMSDLLPGTISGTELAPPDGVGFGVVDASTPNLNGADVFSQTRYVAFLKYSGTLTGIENVRPLFGSNGVVIPEPGTGVLLVLGLGGLAALRRRAR
jgi:hypothetical protein